MPITATPIAIALDEPNIGTGDNDPLADTTRVAFSKVAAIHNDLAGGLQTLHNDIASMASEIGALEAAPPLHASTHATGGSDPITPASIGAVPAIKAPKYSVLTANNPSLVNNTMLASGLMINLTAGNFYRINAILIYSVASTTQNIIIGISSPVTPLLSMVCEIVDSSGVTSGNIRVATDIVTGATAPLGLHVVRLQGVTTPLNTGDFIINIGGAGVVLHEGSHLIIDNLSIQS
jgi:hypothetical protein